MSERIDYHTDSKIRHSCLRRAGKEKTARATEQAIRYPNNDLLQPEKRNYKAKPDVEDMLSHGSLWELVDKQITTDGRKILSFDVI